MRRRHIKVFHGGIDASCRDFTEPTVAKLFSTPRPGEYPYQFVFIVVGTQYGYLRTTGGDVRTWRSYSGARRAARRYVPL